MRISGSQFPQNCFCLQALSGAKLLFTNSRRWRDFPAIYIFAETSHIGTTELYSLLNVIRRQNFEIRNLVNLVLIHACKNILIR